MADLLDAGVAPDTGALSADAGLEDGSVPNMPDFARYVPYGVLDAAKNQDQADQWASEQQQHIADQWGQAWQQHADSTLNDMIANPMYYQQPGPVNVGDNGPGTPAGDAARNTETAAEPAQPQDLMGQFFGHLGNLVDRLQAGASAVGGVAQNAMGDVTGINSDEPVGPGNQGIGAFATPLQAAAQNAPAAAMQAITDPLDAGINVVNAVNAVNHPERPPAPTTDEAVSEGLITPGEATAAKVMGGIAASGPEALAGPAAAATDVAKAGASALGRAVSVAATAPETAEAIGRLGIPTLAGGSEDFAPIARDALTADHPLVQTAAAEVGANPDAVAKLIQSPGFNPGNLAKATGRIGNTQQAALAAYQRANDAVWVQALQDVASKQLGKPVEQLTADDLYLRGVPGIGGRAAETVDNTATAGEPGAELWNASPGLSDRPQPELTPAQQQASANAVARLNQRQSIGPMQQFEGASPSNAGTSGLLNAEGREPGVAPEDALADYSAAQAQWRDTGAIPNGWELNPDMTSVRSLRPTDPEMQAALAQAQRTLTTPGSMNLDEARATANAPKPMNAGDVLRMAERGAVRAKLFNPLMHLPNEFSEFLQQFGPNVPKMVNYLKQADALVKDPDALGAFLQANPELNLSGTASSANDLAHGVSQAIQNAPVVGGVAKAVGAAADANDALVFGTVGKRLQLASYLAAKDAAEDPAVAGAYSNLKYGQIPASEQSNAMRWIGEHVAFAGKWTQGTLSYLGSLIGHPELGTEYGSTLTDAQRTRLARMLRGDFARGVGMLAGAHTAANFMMSGHGPWQNEDGRWLDIETTGLAKDLGLWHEGDPRMYIADPFFRRIQDAVKLAAVPVPGNPMTRALGATTTSTLAGKMAPLPASALALASGGAQYLSPSGHPPGIIAGPPVLTPGVGLADGLKEVAAHLANQFSPVEIRYGTQTRSSEGIKLSQPQANFSVGPREVTPVGKAAGVVGALTGTNPVAGPHDIGTKQEYFTSQEQQAYGDAAKPFEAAGVQLSTMPSSLTVKGQTIPTTAADKPAFEAAYKAGLEQGLANVQGAAAPAQLKAIEQAAFDKGRAAVLQGMTSEEAQRRQAVAGTGKIAVSFGTTSAAPPSSTAAASRAQPTGSKVHVHFGS